MKSWKVSLIVACFAAIFVTTCSKPPTADLVLRNGKIVTVDDNFTIREAVAVLGDKIVFVGDDKEIESYIGAKTEVIELAGKLVLPGLIDAHGHIASYGASLENLNLNGTTSYQQIIDMVAAKVKTIKSGEWIRGRGWDQNLWEIKQFPVHDALSRVSPDNPVYLTRVGGHTGFANKRAMDAAGIDAGAKEPDGGKVIRKKNGEPTGIFIDNAEMLIESKIPKQSEKKYYESIINAANDCLSLGLTSVHDAGIEPPQIDVYKELINKGQLNIRIYAMLSDPGAGDIEGFFNKYKLENFGNHFLTIQSVKLYKDGALGSRGAALLEPYLDDPSNSGLEVISAEHHYNIAKAALKTGMQVNTHAIGDRAIRMTLDSYEKALKENPTKNHRFRIEHSQIISKKDIPRYSILGVIPSMQPASAVSDMNWTEDRVGSERVRGAYAFRDFLKIGLTPAFSSDFPVESNNPFHGMYRAITRQDEQGNPKDGWLPEQRVTIEEAIKGFTIWAAHAAFQENILGSIEVGKLADLVIIDRDILQVEPREIIDTKILYAIVGGKTRYKFQ